MDIELAIALALSVFIIMTEQELIQKVFGSEWNTMSGDVKTAVEKMLSWMHLNLGITKDLPTDDDKLLAAIQLAVVEVFGTTFQEIMSKSRRRDLVDKRHMIFKIARTLSKSNASQIAKLFPNADRSTAMYFAQRKTDELVSVDSGFRYNYYKLTEAVTKHYLELLKKDEE